MLPPVLEIYVVWHPRDSEGEATAEEFVRHFHGTAFTGLIGGAVEIYVRTEGWEAPNGAPRPIPFPGKPPPNGVAPAEIVAVVPTLGLGLAGAVQPGSGPWHAYMRAIVAAREQMPDRVGVFPFAVHNQALNQTELARLVGGIQLIAAPSASTSPDSPAERRCRDLAQGIAQLAAAKGSVGERLTVFISHTKRPGAEEEKALGALIDRVRRLIAETRLAEFFDAHDLQPGTNWDPALREKAGRSALLVLRTDLYATREWCQREMLIAKREGMPIVILDALAAGEERGSFLMDHVPRVPVRGDAGTGQDSDIMRGLNLLVDECLKRALWQRQAALAAGRPGLDIAWWAPHAPEPATLAQWLQKTVSSLGRTGPIRILHPDPPLGADEQAVLEQMADLSGMPGRLDIMTPRLLAARGG